MRVPEITTREHRPRRYLVNDQVYVRHKDVVLEADTESPRLPVDKIPAGTVLVAAQRSSTFVVATDDRAERARPARLVSLAPADPQWATTVLTASLGRDMGFAVVLDANAVDTGSVVDQLNRNLAFSVHFLADEDPNGLVRIRTRHSGADAFMHVVSTHAQAFGVQGTAAIGRDPVVCVADDLGELKDVEGRAAQALVPTIAAGHFRESELIALTPEARRVLSRRGSLFS